MTTTAARECLAVLRRSRRELPVDAFVEHVAWTGIGPETRVLRGERDRAVDAAVAELPARREQLVNAIFRGPGADYAQVARATGMPVGSIGFGFLAGNHDHHLVHRDEENRLEAALARGEAPRPDGVPPVEPPGVLTAPV